VVLVDYKEPIFSKEGVTLITSILRRFPPNILDAKINHLNQLNQIMACIETSRQGADEAIMLDDQGFVAETNCTTIFMVKDETLLTPTTKYIIVGITRGLIIKIAAEKGVTVIEQDLSLYEFYNADEVFICGTVGEIVPVKEIDGKRIGTKIPFHITRMLMETYREIILSEGTPIDEM